MSSTTDDLDQQTFPTLLYTNDDNENQTNNTGAIEFYSMKTAKNEGNCLATIRD
jgi:hypothetical protein